MAQDIPEFSPELLKQNKTRPKVIFVVGPTACGKSALAIELAKRMHGEIISADSMQVYEGMNIGTAKITVAEMQGIPHFGLDLVPASKPFSAYDFRKYALEKIAEICARGNTPFITGGSGLYVRGLLEGLPEVSMQNEAVREHFEHRLETEGLEALARELEKLDPEFYAKVDKQNPVRVIRALEIHSITGQKPSAVREKRETLEDLGFAPVVLGIDRDREWLYEKINERVEQMFQRGLIAEVEVLMASGMSKTAAQAVGYKEIVEALNAEGDLHQNLQIAKEKVQQGSRNLAKRQWTWFKRERGIHWVFWPQDATPEVFAQYVASHLKYANSLD